jgi:4-hydroxy-3-polyprenylbenzoate decarboxylase
LRHLKQNETSLFFEDSGINSFYPESDIGITGEREDTMEKEYVIGVTGASGVCYARRLLEVLCRDAKVHIIISDVAHQIAVHEGVSFEGFKATYHSIDQISAPIASGSHRFDGMVVIPCSAKTLAAIATGYADNLITRSADVCLKEHRPCILVTRETPLSKIHLKNMLAAEDAGATIMPASPGFYNNPKTVDDLVDMVVSRVLDHLKVEHTLVKRWGGYDA